MQIHLLTAFPNLFYGPLDESIIKRARDRDIVHFHIHDIREFSRDKHHTVDDYGYGGGPGMILKPEPIIRCAEHMFEEYSIKEPRVFFLTPQGEQYTQKKAIELAQLDTLILLCGHYKGVDERAREYLKTEDISIGDYVLSGGELPAMVIIDSVVRLLPGAISDIESAEGDSFHSGLLDHPHYTRPEEYKGMRVPDVLLSGHHAKIEEWRKQQSLERTRQRRKDLLT